MIELNFQTWYLQREVNYCPEHFVKAPTRLSPEAFFWIQEKLSGRYYIAKLHDSEYRKDYKYIPYFEDPQEAILYELAWS